jgi:hypothetical protein
VIDQALHDLRAANPFPDDALDAPEVSSAAGGLCDAIVASDPTTLDGETDDLLPAARRGPHGPRRAWWLAATAAVVALVVGVAVLTLPGDDTSTVTSTDGEQTSTTDATVAPGPPAGVAPHYLLEGWSMTRVDEYPGGEAELEGEVDYEGGGGAEYADGDGDGDVLSLTWTSADQHPGNLEEYRSEYVEVGEITVDGVTAALVTTDASSGYEEWIALWTADDLALIARLEIDDEAEAREVLGSLRRAPEAAWTEALPDSAVPAAARAGVVEELLRGLPLPPDLDAGALGEATTTSDRYQLGAAVTSAVACGWFDVWWQARETGDTATEAAAIEAMASARQWPVLLEMEEEGDWPQAVWELADGMAGERVFGTGLGLLTLDEMYAEGVLPEGHCPLDT